MGLSYQIVILALVGDQGDPIPAAVIEECLWGHVEKADEVQYIRATTESHRIQVVLFVISDGADSARRLSAQFMERALRQIPILKRYVVELERRIAPLIPLLRLSLGSAI